MKKGRGGKSYTGLAGNETASKIPDSLWTKYWIMFFLAPKSSSSVSGCPDSVSDADELENVTVTNVSLTLLKHVFHLFIYFSSAS